MNALRDLYESCLRMGAAGSRVDRGVQVAHGIAMSGARAALEAEDRASKLWLVEEHCFLAVVRAPTSDEAIALAQADVYWMLGKRDAELRVQEISASGTPEVIEWIDG